MDKGPEIRVTRSAGPGKRATPARVFQPVAAPAPWKVQFLPGPGEALVISFASVGHDATRAPSPEFVGSATAGGRPALFVADESRSWTNAEGFAEMLASAQAGVKARQPVRQVLLIGQSMGAFAALVAASVIPADAVIAIGPQFSVDPAVMPGEVRWAEWARRIAGFRISTAPLPQGPRITLMHGMADDMPQALAFPRQKGADHLLFPGLAHSELAPQLKARGCLPGLIEAALAADRRRLLRIASSAGGVLRQRLADRHSASEDMRHDRAG